MNETERPEERCGPGRPDPDAQSQRQYACEANAGNLLNTPAIWSCTDPVSYRYTDLVPAGRGKQIIPDDQTPLPAPVFVSFAIA